MSFQSYPLQFTPIFKDRIWGGAKLKTELNKEIPNDMTGESWEISAVEDNVSIVSNGFYKGKSLSEIIQEFPNEILGTAVFEKFGAEFPLLFKYLDAKQDLSIQVHPDDEMAKKYHNSFGKTEMWYVVQADEKARIIVGFKKQSSKNEFLKNIEYKTVLDVLDSKIAKNGDVFFLETGTVHAIGAGLVIAEIQQTSDVTYRIYDFDRKDSNGNYRELHNELAQNAINYKKFEAQIDYKKIPNQSNLTVNCQYFTTNYLPLDGKIIVKEKTNHFTVYMCVEGNFEIMLNNKIYAYQKGDTILIPAKINTIEMSGKATLLEIFIL